jgi:hypothetical protein
MVPKTYILQNLNLLLSKYNKSRTLKDKLFYSKLAVLELSGWTEEVIDNIVLNFARKNIKSVANLKIYEKEIVKRTYGFKYDKDIKKLLVNLVGIINLEKIESQMDSNKQANLSASLTALKQARDSEAHTHIKGVTRVIMSPSVTLTYFNPLYEGLKDLESKLKSLTF